ncbi:Transcriptional regulatory protein moc3 [Fusarium oxysporum f. sp. albedinis]|nr:Transcriptional regulatory protein moc3 [Fusarium oxysporum f. sp. albedinis]
MPAMWDSFKTGTGPSIHQQPPRELKNRPFLRQTQSSSSSQALPQNRSTTSVNSSNGRNSNKSRDSNYDNQTYLQDDFENRLNGLGIQNGPFRYEIRRGKTVRQPYSAGPPRL